MARILSPSAANVATAAAELRRGGVVGMPTETVYGLAGCAFDTTALARIFEAKERPTFDPLIVHVGPDVLEGGDPLERLAAASLIKIDALSPEARDVATRLVRAFWPGPFTLVLPKHESVPDLATSGLATVGLRLPRHPAAQSLIAAAGCPLAAPSANRFGRISPTTAAAVEAELGERIELILDGGPCEIGLESTVVSLRPDGRLTLLRPGGVSRDELARAAGREPELATRPYAETAAPSSPGQLESHYAPRTPLILLPKALARLDRSDLEALRGRFSGVRSVGLLVLGGESAQAGREFARLTGFDVTAVSASPTGDLREIARSLFQCLRTLDGLGATVLFSEPSPSQDGLGHAIADRLSRASFRALEGKPVSG